MPGPQVYGRIPIFQWICREGSCPLRGGLRTGRPTGLHFLSQDPYSQCQHPANHYGKHRMNLYTQIPRCRLQCIQSWVGAVVPAGVRCHAQKYTEETPEGGLQNPIQLFHKHCPLTHSSKNDICSSVWNQCSPLDMTEIGAWTFCANAANVS